ncbi:MAG: phosphotransferase, partial [Bradyrhizobium sp.]
MTAAEASPDTDAALPALAQRLTAQAGKPGPQALTRLAGGRNNQVFRLETADGPLVLKRYFTDARDSRDRLGAEWNFISHAWAHGVRVVPEPLACDRAAQAGLYSFVQGRKLTAAELAPA